MQALFVCLSILLVLCGCGNPEPTPEPFNGTVTFFIQPGSGPDSAGLITETTVTFLAVEKSGLTRLVDAWQDATPEGARYGRHKFPAGTTAIAIAGYYGAVLENAGWKPNVDFRVGGASLHFFGVGSLNAGADRSELQVTVSR